MAIYKRADFSALFFDIVFKGFFKMLKSFKNLYHFVNCFFAKSIINTKHNKKNRLYLRAGLFVFALLLFLVINIHK